MIGQVVEVAEDGRHLAADRGFLVARAGGDEVGRVPLDDVGVLLINAHGVTFSNNLVRALAERGAALVLCGPNHAPYAWLWPTEGHHAQAGRMRAQFEAPKPLCKRLWRALVAAKIMNQRAALEASGQSAEGFVLLARGVRSGDPDNVEAQAARRYWPLLMGPEFRRDRAAGGVNALLNYGYTVLRSATARAVTAAGLHPSIGVHHRNRQDGMCLVDDLMEPFRPLVDLAVARLARQGTIEVSAEAKRGLALITAADMRTDKGATPLGTCLERLATSLARAYETRKATLDLPQAPLPLESPPP
ncbi:MAG: type II CRISPR-associated endonuclease Cas1 [Alphaproteobacteria bacterium]|nr:type II CRISPR-associated endonuclease Cas1 [Alphaproteobacteria bacterium]